MDKSFIAFGAIMAFIGVVAGAFGSHILEGSIDIHMLQVFETGVRYQMYHSLALIFVALIIRVYGAGKLIMLAGWFFLFGILIFSGSLYILSLSGIRWFGAFTPLGGISFLCGWVCLIILALGK